MALLGTMSLFPPVAAPNQPVDCLLNIVNNGATALTVNGIRGLVADAAMKESVSAYAPQFAIGPGMTTLVPSGGGSLLFKATFIPIAPQGWRFLNPNLPQPPTGPMQAFSPAMQPVEPSLPQSFT